MRKDLLTTLAVCLITITLNAQTNLCQIYNTVLDSTYNREFSYYIDSTKFSNDYIDVTNPPVEEPLKNKKLVRTEYFLFIKNSSTPYEETDIQQWFDPKSILRDKKRKHQRNELLANCKFNDNLHYTLVDKSVSVNLDKEVEINRHEKIYPMRVFFSDVIFYNNQVEAIMFLTFYNPNVYKGMNASAIYGVKLKSIKGKWIIKECKINRGND